MSVNEDTARISKTCSNQVAPTVQAEHLWNENPECEIQNGLQCSGSQSKGCSTSMLFLEFDHFLELDVCVYLYVFS